MWLSKTAIPLIRVCSEVCWRLCGNRRSRAVGSRLALAPLCDKQTLRMVLEGSFVVIQPVLELQTQ